MLALLSLPTEEDNTKQDSHVTNPSGNTLMACQTYDEIQQEFRIWLDTAKIKKLGGAQLDERPSYVPDQKIEYFTADRNIKKLLERLDPDNTLVPYQDTIVNEYRKVFCILLVIGRAQHIRTFIKHDNLNDGKLPFEGKPPQFPLALECQDFFQRFQEVQWQFCAMPFTYNMDLVYNDARILPIMTKDAIGSGGSSLIFKVVINTATRTPKVAAADTASNLPAAAPADGDDDAGDEAEPPVALAVAAALSFSTPAVTTNRPHMVATCSSGWKASWSKTTRAASSTMWLSHVAGPSVAATVTVPSPHAWSIVNPLRVYARLTECYGPATSVMPSVGIAQAPDTKRLKGSVSAGCAGLVTVGVAEEAPGGQWIW